MGAAPRHDANVLRELAQLDARLDRLRERLRKGDPDIEPDELQMAIDRAQTKRQQLAAPVLPDGSVREALSMLPKLTRIYREQILVGLNGNPEATARARSILRELIGVVTIKAEGDQIWCEFQMRRSRLASWEAVKDSGCNGLSILIEAPILGDPSLNQSLSRVFSPSGTGEFLRFGVQLRDGLGSARPGGGPRGRGGIGRRNPPLPPNVKWVNERSKRG